jgi:glycosyltransferase involved in cell wall biosynthesis
MNIAIVSFFHSESSLVLAKHLAEKHKVHYFYISDRKNVSLPGIGYLTDKKKFKIGLNEITIQKDHPLFNYLNNINIKITVIAYPTFRPQFRKINGFLTSYFLRRIKKTSFDAVNLIGQKELLLSFYKVFKNNKVIHSLHEVAKHYNEQPFKNKLINFLYTNQIPVIVHSVNSYDRIVEQYPFNPDKVSTIPFGLFETYNFFSKNNSNKGENIILFYGFLMPYKGLSTYIKAIKYAREKIPDITAIIAGSGYDEALELVKNDSTFRIINKYLDNGEMVALNEQAKMIICPYTSASQSGIVTTSAVFNKPIIASDIGGFNEIIQNNVTGYLVEVNNYIEIGERIIELCTNETTLNNMQKKIKEFYETGEYSWDSIASKTTDFYKTS